MWIASPILADIKAHSSKRRIVNPLPTVFFSDRLARFSPRSPTALSLYPTRARSMSLEAPEARPMTLLELSELAKEQKRVKAMKAGEEVG